MLNVKDGSSSDFLLVQEVADYLRVSRNTVWRWCVSGKISAVKVGRNWRIPQTALDKLLEESTDLSPQLTTSSKGDA